MPNQVNKKLKVTVDVEGLKNLKDVQTAIKVTQDEIERQAEIAKK